MVHALKSEQYPELSLYINVRDSSHGSNFISSVFSLAHSHVNSLTLSVPK